MKNIAIIPARSGSKGLKNKNIKLLNGKPLIYYSIKSAQESKMFDEIMISTDSREYADIAISLGANVPFLREEELATDSISSWEVVKDVLRRYKKNSISFDTIALLQPTSPLRTAEDIVEGYRIMEEKKADFVVGVCKCEHSPLWANTLDYDNCMTNFIKKDIAVLPRQEIPVYYRINGALYIIKTDYLEKADDIYSQKSYAHIMPKEKSVDIDDETDFKLASLLLDSM